MSNSKQKQFRKELKIIKRNNVIMGEPKCIGENKKNNKSKKTEININDILDKQTNQSKVDELIEQNNKKSEEKER